MRNASFKICVVALLLALSGCAGSVVECHGQNWYRLGLNDGQAGAQGERESYTKSCGADFDAKQYDEGYKAGARR